MIFSTGFGGRRSCYSSMLCNASTTKSSSDRAMEVCSSSCCTLRECLFPRGRDQFLDEGFEQECFATMNFREFLVSSEVDWKVEEISLEFEC